MKNLPYTNSLKILVIGIIFLLKSLMSRSFVKYVASHLICSLVYKSLYDVRGVNNMHIILQQTSKSFFANVI
jgi:hypothetical protein